MLGRIILLSLIGIINLAICYFMIWGQNGLLALNELKQQDRELQELKADLDAKNLQLSHEIRLLKTDKSFQEKMIRQKLRYVRNNELVYIFDDTKK